MEWDERGQCMKFSLSDCLENINLEYSFVSFHMKKGIARKNNVLNDDCKLNKDINFKNRFKCY